MSGVGGAFADRTVLSGHVASSPSGSSPKKESTSAAEALAAPLQQNLMGEPSGTNVARVPTSPGPPIFTGKDSLDENTAPADVVETVCAEAKAAKEAEEKAAKAALDKAVADKAAAEKAALDKAVADKAAAETAAAEKTKQAAKEAEEKAAKDKAAFDKAVADKVAAEKAAAERVKQAAADKPEIRTESPADKPADKPVPSVQVTLVDDETLHPSALRQRGENAVPEMKARAQRLPGIPATPPASGKLAAPNETLHGEKLIINTMLEQVAEFAGAPPWAITAGLAIWVSLFICYGFTAELVCSLIGYPYPCYQSFKALSAGTPKDSKHWLRYWITFAVLILTEACINRLFFFVETSRGYHIVRISFIAWLYLPSSGGAQTIYIWFLKPLLQRYSKKIESSIASSVDATSKLQEGLRKAAEEGKTVATNQMAAEMTKGAVAKFAQAATTLTPAATTLTAEEEPKKDC